jgi:hypothetical protein
MRIIKVNNPLDYNAGQEIDGDYVIFIHTFYKAIIVGKPLLCLLCHKQMWIGMMKEDGILSAINACQKCFIEYHDDNKIWFAQTNCKYTQDELNRIAKLKAFL